MATNAKRTVARVVRCRSRRLSAGRLHDQSVSDAEGSRLDDPHEAPAPALQLVHEAGLDLVHSLTRVARARHLEHGAAHPESGAEGQTVEVETPHRHLLAHGSRRQAEFVEHFLLHEQHLATTVESRMKVAFEA